MHSTFRSVLAVFLMLSMIGTVPAATTIRSGALAVGQMVLCIGGTVATVYTDALGQPTHAPHIRPEYVLSAVILPPAGQGAQPSGLIRAAVHIYLPQSSKQSVALTRHRTRAPPVMSEFT